MTRLSTKQIRNWSVDALATHVMTEAPTRSFRFKREDGQSFHWFTLTWTPGHLALAGDLGELTLVHYQALATFDGIGWALSADHHYLMSKTNVKQVYDAGETLRALRRMLGEEAVAALNGRLAWRCRNGEDGEVIRERARLPGYRQEMRAYRKAKTSAAIEFANAYAAWENCGRGDAPDRQDIEPEEPTDPRRFERRGTIPDEWRGWVRVWHEIAGVCGFDDPASVTRASYRHALIDAFRARIEVGEHAADFLHRIGFDDYYGTYVWPCQTYWQITAIQHGVRMILAAAKVDPREAADA